MRRALAPLCLCLALLLAACGRQDTAPRPTVEPLPVPTAAPLSGYEELPVYYDGLLRLRGYVADDTLYLGAEDVCALFDLPAAAEGDAAQFRLALESWTLTGTADSRVYTADGRYLYCPEGYRLIEGRLALPAPLYEKLFGLRLEREGESAVLDASRFRLLRGGTEYYTTHFSAEDLFWLSHIIYSEAAWEPLEGQIGVGNVVLNRVKSELFPPTVMAVVLDREHVTQFSPVETGEGLAEPDEKAVLAACLCLEGYNTVGESLYFLNPETGDGTWFENALTPTVAIGNHQFYS